MDTSTPSRKKNRKKGSQQTQTQHEDFTPSILKITTTNRVDLPTQRDYLFANKFTLTKHGLLIGQPVKLTPLEKPSRCPYICQPWPVDSISRNCIAISQTNLELMGLKDGDSILLENIEFGISKATFIRMKSLNNMTESIDEAVSGYLAAQLNGKYVCNGSKFKVFDTCSEVILEATEVRGVRERSVTEQISQVSLSDNSSIPEDDSLDTSGSVITSTPSRCENVNIDIYRISDKTVFKIEQDVARGCVTENEPEISEIQLGSLAGLEREVKEIQDIIDVTLATDVVRRNFRMSMPGGVLVCGIAGVGKTTFLKALAGYYGRNVDVKYAKMENYTTGEGFTKDLTSPSQERRRLILLDDIDTTNSHKDYTTGSGSLASSICVLMDVIREEGGVLVATCRMRDEVDANLRRHGRFEKEIELPAPKSEDRARILQTLLQLTAHSVSVSEVSEVAWRAHGFVAGDLSRLVREATLSLVRREKEKRNLEEARLEYRDLMEGLKHVRPSALRDVILEVPKVKWSDIGGMEDIIQRIKETVEWPLKHPDAFSRLGISPPKGILLYGPPGCSKTMIARAIATESGLNFLAVKGPEIFSKWVGDSEKAIRDIFTKARMASPSIIFFDEIDALAVEREGQGSRVSDRVLTQLLTEMDGLERLEGVTVVAATNRPDLMDKALIRPGRMDRHIYIPIPDPVTRREIFRIKLSKMSCEKDLDLDLLVEKSVGFSGAEIVNVCEEAAMKCLRENINNDTIRMQHLEVAVKSVVPQISSEMNEYYENFNKTTIFRKV